MDILWSEELHAQQSQENALGKGQKDTWKESKKLKLEY